MSRSRLAALAAVAVVLAPASAAADTIHVDATLGTACPDYDPGARTCGSGTERAVPSLSDAAAEAAAGDTVLLREGSYGEVLAPAAGGTAGSPVIYRAFEGETPVIEGTSDPAISVSGLSYVTFEGLVVRDVLGWGRVEDSDHIVFRDMTFERATAEGTTGGLKLVRATQCRVLDSSFVSGNDSLLLQESDRNVVEGCTFMTARHSLLSLRCGNRNFIRGNRFDNPDQKAVEIFDCEGVSDAPFRLDATKRNVIEGNTFAGTLESDRDYRYDGIQYAGQLGIVRRNDFFDCLGGGLSIQVYPDEALNNYGHRAYHNTFVDNRCYGISASDDTGATYHSIVVRNNLLVGNLDCSGAPGQSRIGNPVAVSYTDNVETDSDPGLVDRAGRDFRLADGSALIDAAPFLTTVVGSGTGRELVVVDASYFQDGNGVEGEAGDLVQLEGSTTAVRVTAVDLDANVLTLDGEVEHTDGEGVALAFAGDAPDPGAHERGLAGPGPDGGVPPADAGPGTDGGPARDAGGAADGAAADAGGGGESGGCGCGVADRGSPWPLIVAALALLTARRRR